MMASSCSLDGKLYTTIAEDSYITDAASARNVLFGLYRNIGHQELYGMNLSLYFDLPSDIAKVDSYTLNYPRDFCSNAHSSSHSVVQGTWARLYNTIYNANDFIERVGDARDRLTDESEAVVDVYVAEARVIRALMYFELVRNWKNITLITSTSQSREHPSTYTQSKPEKVYEFIETELKEAAEVLPWSRADNVRPENSFMVSKGSALGLLARVYVTWAGKPIEDLSKWENARDVCQQIMESGMHGLVTDYESLWKNACNSEWNPLESLFEVSFYSPAISSSAVNNNLGCIGKWNGVYVVQNTTPLVRVDARYRAVPTFAAKWPDVDKDKRFALSMTDYYYEGTDKLGRNDESTRFYEESGVEGVRKVYYVDYGMKVTFEQAKSAAATGRYKFREGLYVAKWDLTKYVKPENQISEGNYSNANWYILRYSDVLLMYAEAVNEISGPTVEAFKAVNQVRRRAFGLDINSEEPTEADLPETLSQDEFRTALRNERAYELCFEGQRKHDLIRWGVYYESVNQTGIDMLNWHSEFAPYYLASQYTKKDKNELQPIPQRELDLMPQFRQNLNWGN